MWRAATAVRMWNHPELRAAPGRRKSLTKSVSAGATNVVRCTLVPELIVRIVMMISSCSLNNMIVSVIMVFRKMCRRVPMWLPKLRLWVGNVFHSVAGKASMNLLDWCNLTVLVSVTVSVWTLHTDPHLVAVMMQIKLPESLNSWHLSSLSV